MMDAAEAERAGLVSRVVPTAELLSEAVRLPNASPKCPRPIAMMVKESVNLAWETTLAEGAASRGACFTPPSPPRTARRA